MWGLILPGHALTHHRHPEVLGATSAFTRVFDALWRRASKGDGPNVATGLAVHPSRLAFGERLRMTEEGRVE